MEPIEILTGISLFNHENVTRKVSFIVKEGVTLTIIQNKMVIADTDKSIVWENFIIWN